MASANRLLPILLVALVARVVVIALLPENAVSFDVRSWSLVADILLRGGNPYRETVFLNWPPVWPAILMVLKKLSLGSHIEFVTALRSFLIIAELGLIAVLSQFLRRWYPEKNTNRWLLGGIALNPVCVFLTCQHGNFDVLVALWAALALSGLALFYKEGRPIRWLLAAAAIGMGVATKTVPLILIVLLVPGIRQLSRRQVFFAALLAIGPAALSVTWLFLQSPVDILRKVILYRSSEVGLFGITGFLRLAGLSKAIPLYSQFFIVASLMVMAAIGYRLYHSPRPAPRDLLLATAILLLWIPVFGPGFAPQYLFWSAPFLAASYGLWGRFWKGLLLAGFIVSGISYGIEYALRMNYGYFLVLTNPTPRVIQWGLILSTSASATVLLRVPLFFVLSAVFFFACKALTLEKTGD